MYLSMEKRFYNSSWNEERDETCEKIKELIPEIYDSGNLNYINIKFEAGYWRKANQIHRWFVDNVQDGEDDCRNYYVSKEDIMKLKENCETVLKNINIVEGTVKNGYTLDENGERKYFYKDGKRVLNTEKAEELLPTQGGFFFGGTDYDEYYIHDLKHTITIVDKVLAMPKGWSIYYHSSW